MSDSIIDPSFIDKRAVVARFWCLASFLEIAPFEPLGEQLHAILACNTEIYTTL
jgi:hypothetical protein